MSINHTIPTHVAIIVDGNGRWAKKRFLPRTSGHKAAIKSVRQTIEFAVEKNIQYLTLFAFGRENWQRPQKEIETLMTLLSEVLVDELPLMAKNNIKLCVVGDQSRLDASVLAKIKHAEKKTSINTGLRLNVAIDYSGQWEIASAAKSFAKSVQAGNASIDSITEHNFTAYFQVSMQQPVDLLIRTSGEQRISNFMIWQSAYAELYFCQKLWPDFRKSDFQEALDAYQTRKRRFGCIG